MRQEHITSRQNPLLVHIRKLQASRSYRKASGEFAAEGTKLLEEAAKWYPGLHTVVCRDGLRLCKLPEQVRVVTVPEDVFKSITTRFYTTSTNNLDFRFQTLVESMNVCQGSRFDDNRLIFNVKAITN